MPGGTFKDIVASSLHRELPMFNMCFPGGRFGLLPQIRRKLRYVYNATEGHSFPCMEHLHILNGLNLTQISPLALLLCLSRCLSALHVNAMLS